MTTVMRLGWVALASAAAPQAMPSCLSVSQSSAYGKSNFSRNARLASTGSNETPQMTAPLASNSDFRSRKPLPSIVQPGVSALG